MSPLVWTVLPPGNVRGHTAAFWECSAVNFPRFLEVFLDGAHRYSKLGLKVWKGWGWPVCCSAGGSKRWVYIAEASGCAKIGFSFSPKSRAKGLAGPASAAIWDKLGITEEPALRLAISGCQKQHERALHILMRHEAIGHEWFRGPAATRLLSLLAPRAQRSSEAA